MRHISIHSSDQIKNGGCYSAMLHDLLAMDLGDWHPRRVIKTKALLRQQTIAMSPFDKWVFTVLEDGTIPGHEPSVSSFAYSGPHEHIPDGEGFVGNGRPRLGVVDEIQKSSSKLRSTEAEADIFL